MNVRAIALTSLAAIIAATGIWLYTPDIPRNVLEERYGVKPTDYVTAAGVRLHVTDTGPRDAPPVILLHGFGSSLQTFDAWVPALARDHRVIAYDQPGFGLTGADPIGDYSDERNVLVLAALMDKLGIARASMVGHSMGGKLAWQFAAANPARVDKLILISPDGFASAGFEYKKAPAVPLMLRALPYTMPRFLFRQTLAPAFGDPAKLSAPVANRYFDMMLAPGVRRAIVVKTGQTILRDPLPLLRSIQAPVLLIWGDKDQMIPLTNAADYIGALPHATLKTLKGVGHVVQEEAPVAGLEDIEAFLKTP
jgi:pimeloyl-ACP methyl ester carboxylesterase